MKETRRFRKRYVVFAVLAIGVIWFGYMLVRALNAQPNLATNYAQLLYERCQALQPASRDVDPLNNGWPTLIEALDRLQDVEAVVLEQATTEFIEQRNYLDYDLLRVGRWNPDEFPNEIAVIEDADANGVNNLLDEAAAAPFILRPAFTAKPLIGALLPNLGRFRNLAKCRAAAMRKAAEQKKWEEFERAADHIFLLGQVTSMQATFIDHLVGIAIGALGCRELRTILDEYEVPAETCERLIEILEQRKQAPAAHALECERLMVYDLIQYLHTDNGRGGGQLILSRLDSAAGIAGFGSGGPDIGRAKNLASVFFADRRETTEAVDFIFDTAVRHSELTGAEQFNDPDQIDAFLESLNYQYLFVSTFLSAVDRLPLLHVLRQQEFGSTRLMLALELYASHHGGTLPDSLDALVPEVLDELPTDPLNGKPYGYRLIEPDENDPAGRAYLLYSFGQDEVDNGGKELTEGPDADRRAAREYGTPVVIGFDFVFNAPREEPEER